MKMVQKEATTFSYEVWQYGTENRIL